MPTRRRFLTVTTAGLASVLASRVHAQAGAKTARIVVGFAVGGGTDLLARLMAERLRGTYAPAVIVENRPGAAARIAVDYVKNGDADGSLMLFTPDFPFVVYPHSYKRLEYDPIRDFVPVATLGQTGGLVMSVGPMVPEAVKTVGGLVDWCKANPKQASFATTGAGATPHFVGVMLALATGIDLVPVHYKGGAPAIQALMGGQIPISVNPISEVLPQIRAGKIRSLATSGPQRSRFTQEIPTFVESGYKDVVVNSWLGFFAPAKTPRAMVARINAAINKALVTEELAQALAKFAITPYPTSPEEFAAMIGRDIERWGPVVRASGFTAED
jgi:tripartite-type tricarboxylate transporter receptor subunit TctC